VLFDVKTVIFPDEELIPEVPLVATLSFKGFFCPEVPLIFCTIFYKLFFGSKSFAGVTIS
jgi:hypothetical protein